MNARWREIKERFQHARDLTGNAYRSYLDTIDDPDLRVELESLLDASRIEDDFFEPPRFGSVARIAREEIAPAPTRAGPYRLGELLGAGGMGEVYRAERADGNFEKQVAVKLLKRGLDSDDLLDHFHLERQALAQLEHPNIARLLDGGATADGRPYIVMEYVEGTPVDVYCRERELSIEDRLELFLAICAAVGHAHANLVVHQDLKPGNIVVDGEGRPRLLDFGIARMIGRPRGSDDVADRSPLTPEYASPEQLRGESVTVASDIYSLGAVLYQLLTGQDPHDFLGKTRREIERMITDEPPLRPSTAVARPTTTHGSRTRNDAWHDSPVARRLRRRLAGDLDAILLHALEKRPGDRYPTVEAFAADIRRHLQGLPIQVREGDCTYRALKFLRRNRWAALGTALFVFVLVAGITVITHLYRVESRALERASRERDRALLERERLEKTIAFLQSMLLSARPGEDGRDVRVVEILDRAAEAIGDELADQPRIESSLRTTLARTYVSLGQYPAATEQYEEALRLRREHEGPTELAEALNNLGTIRYTLGEFPAARELFAEAVELNRKTFGDDHPSVAQNLNNLAAVCTAQRDYARALELHRESLAIRERQLGPEDLAVAESLNNLANAHRLSGDLESATQALRRSLEIRQRQLAEDHPLVVQSMGNLGVLEKNRGHLDEAERLLREALALSRRRLDESHPDLAYALFRLGDLLRERAELEEAVGYLEQAVLIRRSALPQGHPQIALAEAAWGACLHGLGRQEDARPLMTGCLPMLREMYGADHPRVRQIEGYLGVR